MYIFLKSSYFPSLTGNKYVLVRLREYGQISTDVFKRFSENTNTPSEGDDLKSIKRTRLNISESFISMQNGSRNHVKFRNGSNFETFLLKYW